MKYRKGNWNLLIGFIIIALTSVLQWNRWGIKILQELDDGDFFFLGGPSLWYPTALFPSIVAIGYIISFLCSLGTVEITQTNGILEISEKKGVITQKVTIPRNSITSTLISNAKIGWSILGIIPLVLSSYYLYIDGISLLTYHAVYGFGIDTGIYYVLQASGNIIAIVLVLFMSPGQIEIRSTHTDRVIIQIPIIWNGKMKNNIRTQIVEELGIQFGTRSSNVLREFVLLIAYGFILITVSIISRIFQIFSNEILRIVCIFSGLLFITHGLKSFPLERKNLLWFSLESNHKPNIFSRYWFYGLSGGVVIITVLTAINNFIYISHSLNVISTIIWNIVFLLIIIVPGICVCLQPIIQRRRI